MRPSLVLACLLLACACATQDSRARSSSSRFATSVNRICPITDEAIDPEVTTTDGQSVAFCCQDCVGEWDALPVEERRAALAKVAGRMPPTSQPSEKAGHEHGSHRH